MPHYTVTDALGHKDLIKNTITDASQATGTVTTRLLEEEDETENGYLNDTQENKVTIDSETYGARYALEFEYTLFVVTFTRYVQKTTSTICLNFKTVAMLSKLVRLDSDICFLIKRREEGKTTSSQMQTATQRNQQTNRSTSGGGRDKLKNVDGDFPACMRLEKKKESIEDHTRKNEGLKGRGGGRLKYHNIDGDVPLCLRKLKKKGKTAAAAMKMTKTLKAK